MKPTKCIKYVQFEFNFFLKSPRQIKGGIIVIHMQGCLSDSEGIIKYLMFKWRLFVIHKIISSCVMGFYDYKSLSLYNGFIETFHINNQKYSALSIYGQRRY